MPFNKKKALLALSLVIIFISGVFEIIPNDIYGQDNIEEIIESPSIYPAEQDDTEDNNIDSDNEIDIDNADADDEYESDYNDDNTDIDEGISLLTGDLEIDPPPTSPISDKDIKNAGFTLFCRSGPGLWTEIKAGENITFKNGDYKIQYDWELKSNVTIKAGKYIPFSLPVAVTKDIKIFIYEEGTLDNPVGYVEITKNSTDGKMIFNSTLEDKFDISGYFEIVYYYRATEDNEEVNWNFTFGGSTSNNYTGTGNPPGTGATTSKASSLRKNVNSFYQDSDTSKQNYIGYTIVINEVNDKLPDIIDNNILADKWDSNQEATTYFGEKESLREGDYGVSSDPAYKYFTIVEITKAEVDNLRSKHNIPEGSTDVSSTIRNDMRNTVRNYAYYNKTLDFGKPLDKAVVDDVIELTVDGFEINFAKEPFENSDSTFVVAYMTHVLDNQQSLEYTNNTSWTLNGKKKSTSNFTYGYGSGSSSGSRGILTITKLDKETNKPIPNVTFTLTAPDGSIIKETTGLNGRARFQLTPIHKQGGQNILAEDTPSGYKPLEDIIFTLNSSYQVKNIISPKDGTAVVDDDEFGITVYNNSLPPVPVTIVITKKDYNNNLLANSEFTGFYTDANWNYDKNDENAVIRNNVGEQIIWKPNSEMDSFSFTLPDYSTKNYWNIVLLETKTPDYSGFEENLNKEFRIMIIKDKDGLLKLINKTEEEIDIDENTVTIYNDRNITEFPVAYLYKTNNNNVAISDTVEFQLHRLDYNYERIGEPVVVTVGANGKSNSIALKEGNFELIETRVPQGHDNTKKAHGFFTVNSPVIGDYLIEKIMDKPFINLSIIEENSNTFKFTAVNYRTGTTTPPTEPTEPTDPETTNPPDIIDITDELTPTGDIIFPENPILIRDPDNNDQYYVYDEGDTPVGIVEIPKGENIDNINIEDNFIPLGDVKPNPPTADKSYNMLAIIILAMALLNCCIVREKLKDRRE